MKRKNLLWAVGIFVLLVIGISIMWFFTEERTDLTLIGPEITIHRATVEGRKTNNAYVSLPYTRDSSTYVFVNIAVDFNKDGKFQDYKIGEAIQGEWIVTNMHAWVFAEEGNSFGFQLPDTTVEERGDFSVIAMLTREKIDQWNGAEVKGSAVQKTTIASVGQDEIRPRFKPDPEGKGSGGFPADLFAPNYVYAEGTTIPNKPPESVVTTNTLRGAPAAAQAELTLSPEKERVEEFHGDVPDITQGVNECVPTATANSLLWLAKKYKFEDKMPSSQGDLISELKTDFQWNATRGVIVPDDYFSGKKKFIQRHNIPIETHPIGQPFDGNFVEKIAQELKKGQDVEIDMEYGVWNADGTYRRVGGHMVTVVGAFTIGDSKFLDFHDPASPGPRKLDIYRIEGTRVVNYKYQGSSLTFIRFAIAESPVAAVSDTSLPPPANDNNNSGGTGATVSEDTFTFSHKIGTSPCPTSIGVVTISGASEGAAWKITGAIPSWLKVSSKQGKTPTDLSLSFNCVLSKYVTQQLSGELKIQFTEEGSDSVGEEKSIHITGAIDQ